MNNFFRIDNLKKYRSQVSVILVLFIIAVLQSTLLNHFRVFNVKPDIILVALIISVSFFDFKWSMVFSFLVGIFRDSFSILPFGLNTIICILWVFLAKQIYRRLSTEDKLISYAVPCMIVLLNNLTLQVILFLLGKTIALSIFAKVVILEFVFALLLVIPLYKIFIFLLEDSLPPQLY